MLRPSARRARWAGAVLCLLLYALLPFRWTGTLEAAGAYSVQALRTERIGSSVELGNAWVFVADQRNEARLRVRLRVRTMSERQIDIVPASTPALSPGRWSIRGRWVATDQGPALQVTEAHRHHRRVRESFSIVGLLLVAWVWLRSAKRLV